MRGQVKCGTVPESVMMVLSRAGQEKDERTILAREHLESGPGWTDKENLVKPGKVFVKNLITSS
jgi:hypothetical protein